MANEADVDTGKQPEAEYGIAAEPVRTDFIDYPTGWRIQREVGDDLDHHPRCSSPVFLCDCGAMPKEWARRAIAQEPHREADIRETLQTYLPKTERTDAR